MGWPRSWSTAAAGEALSSFSSSLRATQGTPAESSCQLPLWDRQRRCTGVRHHGAERARIKSNACYGKHQVKKCELSPSISSSPLSSPCAQQPWVTLTLSSAPLPLNWGCSWQPPGCSWQPSRAGAAHTAGKEPWECDTARWKRSEGNRQRSHIRPGRKPGRYSWAWAPLHTANATRTSSNEPGPHANEKSGADLSCEE